jgi:triacylglycerol lipase
VPRSMPQSRDRPPAILPARWHESFYPVDLLLLHGAPVYYGLGVPHGDGSGVILIPGFRHGDFYLLFLYAWLQRIGYRAFYSGLRSNEDCPELLIQGELSETVSEAHRLTRRRVHLIGHSLGGVLARALAAQKPHQVKSLITLAAPFEGAAVHKSIGREQEQVRHSILLRHGSRVLPACYTEQCRCDFMRSLRRGVPRSVAQTAIYTRNDGVVDWRACRTGDPNIDVEIAGTHAGLAFNAAAYTVIANRLAQHAS